MPSPSWVRRLFARPRTIINPSRRASRPLRVEQFEDRVMPAGGLTAWISPDQSLVKLNPGTPGEIELSGATPADQQGLVNFFTAPDGQALTQFVAATLTTGGQTITGAFELEEFAGGTNGVSVRAGGAEVTVGGAAGVRLSGADGAIALLNNGVAGVLSAADTGASSVEVVGVDGLHLDTLTPDGLTFRLNTTGTPVNKTVGDTEIRFTTGDEVAEIAGEAAFRVAGTTGPVLTVGGSFTATSDGDVVTLAGEDVAVTVFSGGKRVVGLESEAAEFSLDGDGFKLADEFAVSGLTFAPVGVPIQIVNGGFDLPLGPLSIKKLAPALTDVSFSPADGVSLDLGLKAESAGLTFKRNGTTGNGDPLSAKAEGLTGTFTLAADYDSISGTVAGLGATGKFAISADSFDLTVPKVLNAAATKLEITYDPAAIGEQQLFSAESLMVEVPALKLKGEFNSSDTTPGLVVRTDGFAFGSGKVGYTGTVAIGSFLKIDSPFVELGNFKFSKSEGVSVGSFSIGAAGIEIKAGPASLKGEGVQTTIGFDPAGGVDKVEFSADRVELGLSDLVTLSGTDVVFTPTATGTESLLQMESAEASLAIPTLGLTIEGRATNVGLAADGTFTGPETLRLGATLGKSPGDTANELRWPSFIPLRYLEVGLNWPAFRAKPDQFLIEVSASIGGSYGPLEFSGGVDRMVIDPRRLVKGDFPIISLDGFSAEVTGQFGGGAIRAGLAGGILKLDVEGNVLPGDSMNYEQTVMYGGITGGIEFTGIGLEARIGFTQRGLLGAYVKANVPIQIGPVTLTGLRGGVTLNATPWNTPDDPEELENDNFKPVLDLDGPAWLEQLKQQAINQVTSGSRIFDVEDEDATDGIDEVAAILAFLPDSEEPVALVPLSDPQSLYQKFVKAGYAVADEDVAGEITLIEADKQWRIGYKGAVYLLEYNEDENVIEVTEARFTAPLADLTAGLPTSLNAPAAVPASLIAAFAEQEIGLTEAARVEAVEGPVGAPTKWRIRDYGQDGKVLATYFVTARGELGAVTGGMEGFRQAGNTFRIEAGATLTVARAQEAIRADVDVVFEPNGKFLVVGKAETPTVNFAIRMFADFSQAANPNPSAPVKFLVLADIPDPDAETPIGQVQSLLAPTLRLKGSMTFEFLDAEGNLVNPTVTEPAAFRFNLLGRAELNFLSGVTKIVVGGAEENNGYAQLLVTFENDADADRLTVDMSGSLSIEGIVAVDDLISVAGRVEIIKPADGPLDMAGAFQLDMDLAESFDLLQRVGVKLARADLQFGFNTASEPKEIPLALPGRDKRVVYLDPTTFEFAGTGQLQFAQGVSQFGVDLGFDGAFSARVRIDSAAPVGGSPDFTLRGDGGLDLDLFLAARADLGLKAGGERFNLFAVDGMGLIAIRDIGAVDPESQSLIAPTIAGRVDLFFQTGIPGLFKAEGSAQLLLNTSGREFNYVIPDSILSTVKSIQARRLNLPLDEVVLPTLPAVEGKTVAQVPAALPNVIPGENNKAGPYFSLMLGDVAEPPGGTGDTNGDGLVNASLTVANAIKLTGAARIAVSSNGFALAVNSKASIALPGAESLFQSTTTGLLVINSAGLVGALTITTAASLNIPGITLNAGFQAVIGVNTTGQSVFVPAIPAPLNQTLPARSGMLLVSGEINAGGFKLRGKFGITVSGESIRMMIDAGLDIFDLANVRVSATAAIYYGANPGLVLDASLGAGFDLSAPGFTFFKIGADLRLSIDSRDSSRRFEVAVENAHVNLLEVFEATGSGRIVATNDYFRVEGSFSGSLLGIIHANASGFFDSLGNFGLNLDARFQLGNDDWGIRAGGWISILRDTTLSTPVYLAVSAGLYGEVRAAGITLIGARIGAQYTSPPAGDGKLKVEARIKVLFVTIKVGFTLGYIRLDGPPLPGLGNVNGSVLTLNVGHLAGLRSAGRDDQGVPDPDEAYTIDSIGPGSLRGEKVRVRAFGTAQVFDNIESIQGDFGSGDDDLILAPSLGSYRPVTVNVAGGADTDTLTNQSQARATLLGGDGDDVLLSNGTADRMEGGAGNDILSGGAGATLLGGAGADTLGWQVGLGRPDVVDGGADVDNLLLTGTADADTLSLGGALVAGVPTFSVVTPLYNFQAVNVENVRVRGGGGKDNLTLSTQGVSAAGVTSILADLSRVQASQTEGQDDTTLALVDDGAADRVTLIGTDTGSVFSVAGTTDADNGTANVTTTVDGLAVTVIAPNRKSDSLSIVGGMGNDQFEVDAAAGDRLTLSLIGGGGDDDALVPVSNVTFDGGPGTNTATVVPAARQTVTVTSGGVSSSTATVKLANALLTVDGSSAPDANATVKSTPAGLTTMRLVGSVTVNGTSGPLDIIGGGGAVTLNKTGNYENTVSLSTGGLTVNGAGGPVSVTLTDNATVTLAATTQPVTVTGNGANPVGHLVIGTGLLSRVTGNVMSAGVADVKYDNSADGASRTYSLTEAGLDVAGMWNRASVSGARRLELQLGAGDDTVTSTLGNAPQWLDLGEGTDHLTVTLAGSPADLTPYGLVIGSLVAAGRTERVTFDNTASPAGGNWRLSGGQLFHGNLQIISSGEPVMTARFGSGADAVAVDRTSASMNVDLGSSANVVTVGGGNLSNLGGLLTLTAAGNANTLVIDDTASPPATPSTTRPLAITASSFTGIGKPVSYSGSSFSSLKVNLGAANDRVTTEGALPAGIAVNGGPGNDRLTLRAGSGALTFDAGAGDDTLALDRSDAVQPLDGSLTVSGGLPVVGLTGLPGVTTPSGGTAAEYLRIDLGQGNDTFLVNSAGYDPAGVSVVGGAGDDLVTVLSVGGAAGKFAVLGDSDLSTVGDTARNTVRLVAPNPTAGQFAPVVPRVQRLVVDHTAGTAPVGWVTKGTSIYAGTLPLVDADGATRIDLLGRTAGGDTLDAQGTDPSRPVQLTLSGDRADVYEGLNVLSQSARVDGPDVGAIVSGLTSSGFRSQRVATAAAAGLVFTVGGDEYHPVVGVYRSAGPNGPLQFVRTAAPEVEILGTPAVGLAATPDGRLLFRASRNNIYVFSVNSLTGDIQRTQILSFSASGEIFGLQVSPDGSTLAVRYYIGVRFFDLRDVASDGILRSVISEFNNLHYNGGNTTFSDDSQFAYVWTENTIQIYRRSADGNSYEFVRLANNNGIDFDRYTTLRSNADGSLLFAGGYVTTGESFPRYMLDVFRVSSDPNVPVVTQVGNFVIGGVGRLSSFAGLDSSIGESEWQLFKYDDSTQTLVLSGAGYLGYINPELQFYHYDAGTGTFSQTTASLLDLGGSFNITQGWDVGRVGGTTYAAIAEPYQLGSGQHSTGLAWYTVSPLGVPSSPSGIVATFFYGTPNRSSFVNTAIVSDPTGATRILGVKAFVPDNEYNPPYSPWNRNEYSVYAPTATSDADALATLSLPGMYVQNLAAYADADGAKNVWWAIEAPLSGPASYTLKRYVFDGSSINATQSIPLTSAGRISFNPAGTEGYVETATGRLRFAVEADGTIGALLGTDAPQGAYPVAAGGYQFSAPAGVDGLDFVPAANPAATPVMLRDGFGNLGASRMTGLAVSADLDTIYVSDDDNARLRSLRIVNGVYTEVARMTSDARQGLVRVGNQLYLADSNVGLKRLTIGANGLPDASTLQQSFVGSTNVAVSGNALFTAQSGLLAGFNASNTVLSPTQTISDGQSAGYSLTGVTKSAASPDGRFLYAYSATDKSVAVYDRTTGNWSTHAAGINLPFGVMDAITDIVVRQNGNRTDALFVNAATGGVIALTTTTNAAGSVTVPSSLGTRSYLVGTQALAYSPADGWLYVANATQIRRLSVPDLMNLPASVGAGDPTATVIDAVGLALDGGKVYAVTSTSSNGNLYYWSADLTGAGIAASALYGATGIAARGNTIYVSSSQGAVYILSHNGMWWNRSGTVSNNIGGVTGIAGASAVTMSGDGAYVFVAGRADNAVAVFLRNPATGQLTFLQAARNGRTADGMAQPSGLLVLPDGKLAVAAGGPSSGNNGGFALLNVAAVDSALPANVQIVFQNLAGVTLTGGNEGDTIRLIEAPTPVNGSPVTVTLLGGGSDDGLAVSDVGPAGSLLTVDVGSGNDQVTVNQVVLQSGGSRTLTVVGGSGNDEVSIQTLPIGTNATVNVAQSGADIDVVRVRGRGVPATSGVTVNGDLGTGSGATFAGDALIYDGQGATLSAGPTSGSISLSGQGTVTYTGLSPSNPQQVFLVAAPRPSVTLPVIAEGQSATMSAADASGQPNVSYSWDLNGDGEFSDASGQSITLTWDQLKSFGISSGPRSYPVAVRATSTQNAVVFSGRVFRDSADAAGLLAVADTAPTLALVGGNATLGVAFALPLSANDPGDDRVTQWSVNWGDGTTEVFGADATSASHVYVRPGDFTVTVTASNNDGNFSRTGLVAVRPGAGSVTLDGPYALAEGDSLSTHVSAAGTPARYEWDFGNNGTVDLISTGPTLIQTWSDLSAFGITDNGAFQVKVTAVYDESGVIYSAPSAAVGITVTNTAPTGTLTPSAIETPQGSAVSIVVADYGDPSTADTAATATVGYDFNNDGTIDLAGQPVGSNVEIPAEYRITPGLKTVRAVLTDKDGGSRTLFGSYVVTPVTPTVTLGPVATIDEGGMASLSVSVNDPGGLTVTGWRVSWGDGTTEEITTDQRSLLLTHQYGDDGHYPVTVTALTSAGDISADTTAIVRDVAPTVTLNGPTNTTQGTTSPYAVTLTVTDPGADTVTGMIIDWGDGTLENLPGDATSASHIYRTLPPGGHATVRLTSLTNDDGDFADLSNALTVAVVNAAPFIPSDQLTVPPFGVEGGRIDLSAGAVSVATGWEPLTFAWTVTGPTGATVASMTRTAAPVSLASLATFTANDEIRLTAGALDTRGNDLTFTWTLTPAVGPTMTLTGNDVSLALADGVYDVAVSATSTTGTATGTAVLTVTGGLPTLTNIVVSDVFAAVNAVNGFQYVTRSGLSFTPVENGTYTVTLTVTDSDGGAVTETRAVQVFNVAPTITNFNVPETGTAGQPLTFSAMATDPAGADDPLTYSWTVTDLASGAVVATLNGASVNLTPSGGSYAVKLDVTDGDGGTDTQSARLDVTTADPVIPDGGFTVPATGLEGDIASFAASVISPTSPAPTVRWRVQGPTGPVVVLDGATVQYTWPRPGSYTVTAIATDRFGTSVSRSATVQVGNVAPAITSVTLPTADWYEGVGQSFTAAASDPGVDEVLQFLWTFIPVDGLPTQLGGPSPTFVPADNGVYTVTLTVTDEDGAAVTMPVGNITVANVAPEIETPTLSMNRREGQTVRLAAPAATDVAADLAELTYTWTITTPAGETITYSGPVAEMPLADSGNYQVRLIVADADGGQTERTVLLPVANQPPVLTTSTIPTRGYVGKSVALSAAASDMPADPLGFAWTVSGPGGSVSLTGFATSFIPTVPGDYAVTLVVTDKDGGTTTTSGTTTVVASPVSLTSFVVPASGNEGTSVELSATATDELGGPLTFTWTITPPTGTPFTLTGPSGSFVPPDDGSYHVSLTVSSPNGLAVMDSNVVVANRPPVITAVTLPVNPTAAMPVTLSATAADPSGTADTLTYTWSVTPPGGTPLTFTGTAITFTPAVTGLYEVRLIVADEDGGTAAVRTILPILNAPPEASAGGPYTVAEGGLVQLSAAGSSDNNQSASSLTYAWDLDGNGIYGEASTPFGDERGMTPVFSAITLDGPTIRTIHVRVTDAYGATDTATATVEVTNVAPKVGTLTVSAPAIDENGMITVSGTFTDPGLADGHTVTLAWGDGTPDTVLTLTPGARSFSATHRYLDNPANQPNGAFTIQATVTDDNNGSGAASAPVTVRNVAPMNLTIGGRTMAVPGLATSFSGTFTDPGTLDTHSQTWTVVRSTAPFTVLASGNGSGLTFIPPTVGSYVVTYTVTDKDGGSRSISRTLTVTPTVLIDGVLYVGGTSQDDEIEVSRSGSSIRIEIETNHNKTTYTVPAAGVIKVVVFGLAGNDEIEAKSSLGTLPTEQYGGDGHDELTGGDGSDLLDGGAGNDELKADLGDDTLLGGDGNDELRAGRGNDLLYGGAGNDELIGRSGDDTLRGGTGDDCLTAGTGRDHLFGDDGNDSLRGGSGGDVLDGGAGNDTIRAGSGGDIIGGGTGNDLLFAGSGNDRILGNDGDDTIYGSSGCDVLDGGAGHDLIFAGSGGDTVYGGAGNDTITGGSGSDLLDGGDGDDCIAGCSGDDTIRGGSGNDRLDGESGNDWVDGEAGHDTLLGGSGSDTLLGGNDSDVFLGWGGVFVDDILGGGAGFDRIDAGGLGGGLSLDNFSPAQSIERITGTAGRTNWVDGTSGNNTLDFSATELQGISFVDGGSGHDMIVATLFGTGLEYRGGSGNDTLVSSLAADRLRGESGADVFRITRWTNGGPADQILDFSKGSDKIDLRSLGIRASDGRNTVRSGGDTVLTIALAPLNGQQRTLSLRLVGFNGVLDTNDFLFAV